ncbi:MAG: diphosphomevalonate decarboxylase [Candidatus Peregrinibacteria bacterium]|nr:diphosphomevalonate decarboxylase [Candidatus Peregrinibacteria bacterium]
MPATAIATPNIALIKYWGNQSEELRLPAADSLSMTLDTPSVEVTVEHSKELVVYSYLESGLERTLTDKHVHRFGHHLALMKQYLDMLRIPSDVLPASLSITIRSHIPPSIGLASSAAVFAGVARAVAGLVGEAFPLSDEQVSVMARLGSGSAARSIYGGYVALRAGKTNSIDAAHAEQIADEKHWILHDIAIIPSQEEKAIGSTEGHALASTSPYFVERVDAIMHRRLRECIDAIKARDFEKLQHVAEEDALDMHKVMETSTPALNYLTKDTHRIITEVKAMRERQHLPVLYTMDAGPTVHLFCTEEARLVVLGYARSQKSCTVFETQTGPGARST